MPITKIFSLMGPGLLYAAAAIGVSHLVQSTRAGADFGFQLVWAVLLANILKYPFFKIGPLYTAITQKSLLHGYKEIGRWAIYLFILMTIGTMFVIQAAVTIVTAGLAINLFGLSISAPVMSLILLILSSGILLIGKYNILDNFIKVIIIVLTITTIASLAFAVGADFSKPALVNEFSFSNKAHIFFLIALIGWMPAPMDIPVWHSMWAMAKNQSSTQTVSIKDSMLDFKIGFFGTAILALCFLGLGSLVMYRSGEVLSGSAIKFSAQLVSMYTQALGPWAFSIIAIAAFTTMFSTTLTCLDAFPRILAEATRQLKPEQKQNTGYKRWMMLVIVGACTILFFFTQNMKGLVDFATTLSFVVAPIYAYLNFSVMKSKFIPKEYHPSIGLSIFCYFGFGFFTLFSLYFLYLRFFS